jgi:hypothetical protein
MPGDAVRKRSDGMAEQPFIPPNSAGIPPGWVRYHDYAPECEVYVPSEKQYLPPSMAWEPCEAASGDAGLPGASGIECKRMVTDWAPGPDGC